MIICEKKQFISFVLTLGFKSTKVGIGALKATNYIPLH